MFALMVREPKHQDQLQSMVFAFFKEYKIARLIKQSNITKQAGIAVLDVFRFIFELVFTQRSLNRCLKQSNVGFGKDTVYRFFELPPSQLETVPTFVEFHRYTTDSSTHFRRQGRCTHR